MRGLGGWLAGPGANVTRDPQALFGDILKHDSAPLRGWHRGPAGLVLAGDAETAALCVSGTLHVALIGRAIWRSGPESATSLDHVCRRFLGAYRDNRLDALQSLHGEFALVATDTATGDILLAVDRFGIQSLVYQVDAHAVIFGSNCDIVVKHPDASAAIDAQAVFDYTYFHVVPGPRTIYRGVKRLLPGHCLTWSAGQSSVRPYWSMAFHEQRGSIADFKPRFRQVLREAVATAASGASCGAFLSGGTDSSTVSGLLGEVTGFPAKTYSIGFAVEGYDEMEYARIASRHFGTRQHEYYVTPEDVQSALPMIAGAYDQPFGNASAVAAYYCARLAKSDGVTRMLAGDGGDEIFGGNSRYAKQYQLAFYERLPMPARRILESLLRSRLMPEKFPLVRKARSYVEQASLPMPARYDSYNLIDYIGPTNLFTREFLLSIDVESPRRLMQETHASYRSASLINQMLGIDLKFTLADSDLPKVTRMCELAGVDVAFPLLDESVVEFSATLPANLKLRGTQLRYFFKEALRDFLPVEILRKQKHGFGLPVGAWLTTHPRLKTLAGDNLSTLKGRGVIAPEFIDRLLDEYLGKHAAYFGTMAWVLLMLELWFQAHPGARVS